MNKTSSLMIGLMLGMGSVFAGPYDAWTYYRDIIVNTTGNSGGANVPGDVNNFPVLVRLNNGGATAGSDVLSQSLANGEDVRFTDSTGNTALNYQIERWTVPAAEIWVNVPTVTGNANTKIRMYWGKSDATSASSGTATFDTATGFQAVWHMNGNSGANEADATANSFTARDSNTINSTTTSVIGLAKTFVGGSSSGGASGTSGSNEAYIVDGSGASSRVNFPEDGHYTLSGWFRPTDNDANRSMITKSDNQYSLKIQSTTSWEMVEYNQAGTGTNGWQSARAPLTTNTWVHLVGVRDGLNEAIYANGVLASNTPITTASATARNTTTNVCIGKLAGSTRYFAGQMDEVRIASVGPSWIMKPRKPARHL